jgi:outer membrane protein TolC
VGILFAILQAVLALTIAALVTGCTLVPTPYKPDQFAHYGNANVAMVAAHQEPLDKPIDLYEAMARALKYNLNYQVEMRQTSLRAAELNLAHYSLLPNAVASSGYLARNNDQASSSFNLSTGAPNFAASTSQDKRSLTADLTFSWNILDFGLSYVRANQAADRVLIGEEMQRKVKHKLLEDVRTAYWRAYSYERLMAGLQKLEKKTEAAISNSRAIAKSRQTTLMTALMYERELTQADHKRAAAQSRRGQVTTCCAHELAA